MNRSLQVVLVNPPAIALPSSPASQLIEAARLELERGGFAPRFQCATNRSEFLALAQSDIDVVLWHLADVAVGGTDFDVSDALKVLGSRAMTAPLLIIGALSPEIRSAQVPTHEETIAQWIRGGVADYVRADRLDRLSAAVRRALDDDVARTHTQDAAGAGNLDGQDAKFRALIENAADIILVVDEEARILYGSPSCERVLGYKSESSLGRNALFFVHPDDAEPLMAAFEPIIPIPNANIEVEFRFLHADGSWHVLEVIGKNLLHDAAIGGIVLNGRDITDRKRIDNELRFRADFENLTAQISTQFLNLEPHQLDAGIDAALQTVGQFLEADRAYVFQFDCFRRGESPESAVRLGEECMSNSHEWCAPNIVPFRDQLQNLPQTQFPWLMERLLRLEAVLVPRVADLPPEAAAEKEEFMRGGIRSLMLLPVISHGALLGFLGFDAVLSERVWSDEVVALAHILGEIFAHGLERRRAETALRESENRYRTLVETSPDAVGLFDLDAKLIMCNPQKAMLHGFESPEQMIGRSAWEFLAPEEHTRAAADIQKIVHNGNLRHEEYALMRRDGSRFEAELSVSLISDDAGQPRALASIARDISSRKKAEAQIQRQLQQITALRNIDMAITASHDLRLTLNVILDQVLSQLHVDAACVLLLNPHSAVLEYAGGRGFFTDALKHTRLRLGESHAGRAALERRTVSVPDLNAHAGALERATALGAEKFASYFGVPLLAKGKVEGVLEVFHRTPLEAEPDWLEFLEILAGQTAIAIDNAHLLESLQKSNSELNLAYDTTLEGWSHALDLRDKETEGHTRRVTEYTVDLARLFGLSESELVLVRRGSLLHDIGKMGIPDSILLKPGKLTEEEWAIMKMHPIFAYELLSPISYLRPSLDIPYCHHEKWDGSGYPRGLREEQIPISSRLFAVIDVWDALRSDRPYRLGWPAERVLQHIRDGAGTHFDPEAVRAFEHLNAEALLP